jgi:hypothetical protein
MADIKQTIQDFYKVAQTKDFARNYQFRVLDVSNKGASVFTEDQLVYATTAAIPGKKIKPVGVPYSGFNFNIPGPVEYNLTTGYQIAFYLDAQSTARTAMENWVQETFDETTSTGDQTLHNDSTITLAQLDNEFEVIRTYKLFGVFPVEAADISYTISAADGNVVTFNATFAYQFFRRDNEIGQVVNKIGKLL